MRTRSLIPAAIAVAALLTASACHHAAPASTTASGQARIAALYPLDEAHAEQFRRAFDAAKDRPRYVVALSPT